MGVREDYPEAEFDPDPTCPYCHGSGLRPLPKGLEESPFVKKGPIPCYCIFFGPDTSFIAPLISEWATDKLREMG